MLLAFWNEPAAAAQVFHYATLHHFFVEATKQTVERLSITQSDGHANHPYLVWIILRLQTTETPSDVAWQPESESHITI